MDWGDVITKAGAGVGTFLGVVNAWRSWRQSKVQIRVTPTRIIVLNPVEVGATGNPVYGRFFSPGILIVNLSSFAVTIEDVGYEFPDGERYALSRIDAPGRFVAAGLHVAESFPQRLESHTSLRVALWDKEEERIRGMRIHRAYAKTSCGTTVVIKHRLLRSLTDQLTCGEPLFERVETT
jgi:hypothetical protein